MKKTIIVGIILIAVVMGVIGCTSSSEGVKETISKQFNKEDAIEIDYKELKKDAEEYRGEFVYYTGQVAQIQVDGNNAILRLAVGGQFDFDSIIWVDTTKDKVNDVVDGDYLTVYGELTGDYTYTSQANYEITIPSMDGYIIEETSIEEINEKEGAIVIEMFEAIEWEVVKDSDWSTEWQGIIKNHTDKDYEYLNANIKFIDANGVTVDNQNIYIFDGLSSGEEMHVDFTHFKDKPYDNWGIDSVEWRIK